MIKCLRCMLATLSVLALALPLSVQAAVFCATTTAQLEFTLDEADSNGHDDEIRIAQGLIAVPQGEGFRYEGGTTFMGDDNDLTISGGWVPRLGNPCGVRPADASAFVTVLTGEERERILEVFVGEQSDVTITGITFLNAVPSGSGGGPGGALYLGTVGETAGTFTVERSAFIANRGLVSAFYTSRSNTTRFINNLVVGNSSASQSAAVGIAQNDQNGVYVINNTIISNLANSGNTAPATGIRVFVSGTSQALIASNILWGNDRADIHYDGNGFYNSQNNSIQSWVGIPDSSQNNVSIEPTYEPDGPFDFTLEQDSPLTTTGLIPPPDIVPFPTPFHLAWSLPDLDLYGESRIANGRVDIGAYETPQDRLFSDRFE